MRFCWPEASGRVLCANARAEALFGRPRASLLKSSLFELVPGLSLDGCATMEVEARGANDPPLRVSASVHQAGDGECSVFAVQLKNPAARNALLEHTDRLLAEIVRCSDDAILSKTLDGEITSWNRAAERIFGYSESEAVGRNVSFLFPPDRLDEEVQIVSELKAGRDVDHYETVRLHKNGSEILVSLSVAPIRNSAGEIVGASKIARDITEKKHADAHARLLQSEIAHYARVSEMGQMSAEIAHELNQPLTAIANYVQAAKKTLTDNPSPEKLKLSIDLIERIGGQAIRAGSIIKKLRAFVEKRSAERTQEDVNSLIEEALAFASVGFSAPLVDVSLSLAKKLPRALVDKVQIQQVLLNLIRNGMEAMEGCKKRTLSIGSRRASEGLLVISVSDTGPGLAPEIEGRLFEPFVSTKEEGMGIGLNICRNIVEAHGGSISAGNGKNGGAWFEIMLPVCAAA